MEENEVLEETYEENIDVEEGETGSGSADPEEPSISDEQILDAIRGLVEESQTEESTEEDSSEVSEEESSEVDYSEVLENILAQLEEDSLQRQAIQEEQNISIVDKPLSSYTVIESLLCVVVVFFVCKAFIKLIKDYTPFV